MKEPWLELNLSPNQVYELLGLHFVTLTVNPSKVEIEWIRYVDLCLKEKKSFAITLDEAKALLFVDKKIDDPVNVAIWKQIAFASRFDFDAVSRSVQLRAEYGNLRAPERDVVKQGKLAETVNGKKLS